MVLYLDETQRDGETGREGAGDINKGLHVDGGAEKGASVRGMKKEILIAWQVRLFRNIQRRCTECVLSPLPPLVLPRPRPWRVETPFARMVSAVSRIPKTTQPPTLPLSSPLPRSPRLVRQNEPDSVDLYERVKKNQHFRAL